MPTERYGFFDSQEGDERDYAEADLRDYSRLVGIKDGVYQLEELAVTSADDGLKIQIGFGGALVGNYWYVLDDDGGGPLELAHEAASSQPRIDRVIIRRDSSTDIRDIRTMILKGEAASSPVPPELTRGATVWDISLARVYISVGAAIILDENITDERPDADLCGILRPKPVTINGAGQGASGDIALSAGQVPATGGTVQSVLDSQGAQIAANAAASGANAAAISTAQADITALKASPAALTGTLPSAGWTGSAAPYSQILIDPGLHTTGYLYLPYPQPGGYVNWARAQIAMQNVANEGQVTFLAQKLPTADIPIHIARWRMGGS
jgi:hypothetical protein